MLAVTQSGKQPPVPDQYAAAQVRGRRLARAELGLLEAGPEEQGAKGVSIGPLRLCPHAGWLSCLPCAPSPASPQLPGGTFAGYEAYVKLMEWCWAERPEDRPTFEQARAVCPGGHGVGCDCRGAC